MTWHERLTRTTLHLSRSPVRHIHTIHYHNSSIAARSTHAAVAHTDTRTAAGSPTSYQPLASASTFDSVSRKWPPSPGDSPMTSAARIRWSPSGMAFSTPPHTGSSQRETWRPLISTEMKRSGCPCLSKLCETIWNGTSASLKVSPPSGARKKTAGAPWGPGPDDLGMVVGSDASTDTIPVFGVWVWGVGLLNSGLGIGDWV